MPIRFDNPVSASGLARFISYLLIGFSAVVLLLVICLSPAQAADRKVSSGDQPAKPAGKSGAAAKPDSASKKGGSSLAEGLGLKDDKKSNEPLTIKSKTVDLDSKERIFTYRGDVVATRADLIIKSDIMTGKYDEQNKLQTVIAEKNVIITRGTNFKATSNRAVYNLDRGIIELTEGPQLFRDTNALTADKVKVFVDEDRSEAEGNVQVKVIKSDESSSSSAVAPTAGASSSAAGSTSSGAAAAKPAKKAMLPKLGKAKH